MTLWRNIKCEDSNTDDEVVCSKYDDAYQITSTGRFAPETKVDEYASLKAKVYASGIYIAIDCTLMEYDPTLQKVIFCKDFESKIEAFSVLEKASLVAVSVGNGRVHCFSTEDEKIIFQWDIEGSLDEPTVVEVYGDGKYSFVIVGKGKRIYRARIPQLDGSSNEYPNIMLECFINLEEEVLSSCICLHLDGSTEIFFGGKAQLFKLSDSEMHLKAFCPVDNDAKVVKILVYSDNSIIVCLLKGKLLFHCCFTLMCLKVYDKETVHDFALIVNEKEEKQVIIIADDGNGRTTLQLLDILDFTSQLTLEVNNAVLVECTNLTNNLFFLEGSPGEGIKENLAYSVDLKSIAESNPSDRLKSLLKKDLFQEASEHASKHGLDAQEIYKAQFYKCMQLIHGEDAASTDVYSHLTALIGQIKNITFVINVIFDTPSLDLPLMKSLLSFSLESIPDDDKFGAVSNCISEHLHLLDTITILCRNNNEKWTSFTSESLMNFFHKSLDNGAWLDVWLIWERHWDQCLQQYNSIGEVIQLLDKLTPETLTDNNYTIIKSVISKIVQHFPDAGCAIADWVILRIKYFEAYDNWPDSALVFAENVYSYLDKTKNIDNHFVVAMAILDYGLKGNWDSLHLLYDVIEILKDIKYFKSELAIEIRLSEYDVEEKDQLVHVLLSKIRDVHDYDKVISGFIIKYVIKHGLNFDDLIEDVVKDFISATYWPNELDERVRKAVALTRYIKDAEVKGRCILELMKSAPLPWEETLSELVSLGTLLNHPISESITLQLNIMNALVTLKKYNLECCHVIQDFQMIITHIINVGNDEMVEDCLSVASTEAKKEEVYTRCSESYIRQRNYDKAFNLWNSLPKKVCIGVLQRIVHSVHAASLIQGFEHTDVSYIDNLKFIEMHLAELLKDSDDSEYIIEAIPLKKLKGDYFVKKYIDAESEIDDIRKNASLLNKSLSRFAGQSYANTSASDLLLQMKKLSEILDCGVEEILIDILLNFNEEEEDALSMALITQLLLSVQGETEIHIFGYCMEWILSALISSSLKEDCARNIQKLLWRNLAVCNARDKPICLELCQFLKLWFSDSGPAEMQSMSTSAFLTSRTFLQNTPEGMPPIDLLQGAIMASRQRHYWFSLFSQAHSLQEFEIATESLPMSKSISEYQLDCSSWVAYQVDCSVAWSVALWSDVSDMMLKSTSILLSRLVSYKEFNMVLMVALVSSFEKETMIKWLNVFISRYKGDLIKVHSLANMAEILCELYEIQELSSFYAGMNLKCIVDKRLKEIGMIADVSVGESSEIPKDIILKKMMDHRNISAANVEEICFLCNLDSEEVFLKYLEHLLLTWTPKYSVKVLLNGQEEIVILNSVDEIQKVFSFVSPLVRMEVLCKFLHDIWDKVNYYHYEVYDVILDILMSNNSTPEFVFKHKNMIRFLKNYNRVSAPTSTELNIFDDMGNLPKIAKWRLPLLTINYKNAEEALPSNVTSVSVASSIVGAEVNFQNYAKWLKAPQIPGLDARTICSLAIKQGIRTYLNDGNNAKEWQVYPSKENFLHCVKECVMQMPSLKYATAAINYTAAKLPQGIDQVMAMELCLSLAQSWMSTGEQAEEAKSVGEKVESKYLSLSLKHLLYTHSFGVPKYLELIAHPEELISRLYYDVTHFETSVLARKDGGLNSVAEKIANLFAIDLVKLKLKLISKWMSAREENISSLDMTCVGEMFAKEGRLNAVALDEELIRLLFICQSIDTEEMIIHFKSIAFPPYHTSVKLKVLLCLWETDEGFAVSLWEDKEEKERKKRGYLKKLYFLQQLEELGIFSSYDEYKSLDTKDLVKSILCKKPLHPISIFLAAELCLSTGIFDHFLWSEIFKKMINMSMELAEILPLIRPHWSFTAVQTYREAWKELIEAPFYREKTSMTYEEEQKCMSSLQLFHLCPFLVDMDLHGIAEKYLKRDKVELAVLLLPFLPTSLRTRLMEALKVLASEKDFVVRMKSLPKYLQVYCYQVYNILSQSKREK